MITSSSASPASTSAVAAVSSNVPNVNSVVGGVVDRRPWQYWDTFFWPLASPAVPLPSEVAMFTVPINQLDVYTNTRKTKLQTNMTASGQFVAPECILLQQIGIYICAGDSLADINKYFENCYMEFKINQKIFWEGQPWQFPSGVGMTGYQNPTGTAEYFVNGFPAPQATRRAGSFSKYIAPLQPFTLKFFFPGTPPTLASAFKLVVFLDGLSDAPVA